MIELTGNRRQFLTGLASAAMLPLAPGIAAAHTPQWTATRALMRRYIDASKLAGAIATIGRGTDEPIFVGEGGIALGEAAPVAPDTIWRIYSMTKPVTGMAAMMLIEDGKLKLDQNIADFLPGFANPTVLTEPDKSLAARPAARPITIRHLLTHTAGLGYTIVSKGPLRDALLKLGLAPIVSRPEPETGLGTRPSSLAEFAERLSVLPLIADPGTVWSYSLGLDLLGRIIEIASGQPFDAFLKARIFDPLGMIDTGFTVPASKLDRLATNYMVDGNGLRPIDYPGHSIFSVPPAFPFGGAGLVSTARDYDRFLTMMLGEGRLGGTQIMAKETARLAMSDILPEGVAKPNGWGYGAGGYVTIKDQPGGQSIGTFGWAGAAGTIAWADRGRRTRGSWFVQYMPSQTYPLMSEVPEAVYKDIGQL